MVYENINVFGRIRPSSEWIGPAGVSCVSIDPSTESIIVNSSDKPRRFDLNKVFDENSKQETIFAKVGRPIVDGFIEGIHGTICAYGQTGSGKTFTMLGPDNEHRGSIVDEQRGITPRALEYLFFLLKNKSQSDGPSFKFNLKCSFVELYNEKLSDLLNPDPSIKIQVQSSLENIKLAGVTEYDVASYDECIDLLWKGWNQRKVAETAMNNESSRSHAIFMLTLDTELVDGDVVNRRTSRLNLVDLAGSERQGQTKNSGARLREAGNINKSLSILARVIRTLASSNENKKSFVPYRDSVLTLILRDSLGGNARTAVIVNIHPNRQFVGDTISTLQFADNVKKVQNTATVNESISCEAIDAWKAEILRLREENRELKAQKDGTMLNMSIQMEHDCQGKLEERYRHQLTECKRTAVELEVTVEKLEAENKRLVSELSGAREEHILLEKQADLKKSQDNKDRRQTMFSLPSRYNHILPSLENGLIDVQLEEAADVKQPEEQLADANQSLQSLESFSGDYQELLTKFERKKYDLIEVKHDLERSEKESSQKSESIVKLRQDLVKMDGSMEKLESDNAKLSDMLTFTRNDMEDLQARYTSLMEEKELLDSELASCGNIDLLDNLGKEKEILEKRCQTLEIENAELKKQRDSAFEKAASMNGHTNQAQKIHHVAKITNELKEMKNENAKLKAVMAKKQINENGNPLHRK